MVLLSTRHCVVRHDLSGKMCLLVQYLHNSYRTINCSLIAFEACSIEGNFMLCTITLLKSSGQERSEARG